jgi:lysophospholipase L1-like esterase
VLFSCEPDSESIVIPDSTEFNILSLGDSYTIGEGVCENCNYPNQLIDTLKILNSNDDFYVDIVAQTGWSTTALINNIGNELESNYDIVTLLIGVNNQFWNLSFETYENEFIDLLNISRSKTKSGDFNDLVVISIPDYSYTPYSQSYSQDLRDQISSEIDMYNNFAQNYCYENEISFVYITDITRLGLENPELVSNDNLHPSESAYTLFVERILPVIEQKIYN